MPPSRLPLFPLPAVLLPGSRKPLHIFEPRYRRMLRDCLDSDRVFGLIYCPDDIGERDLAPRTVGCRAYIDDVEPLADGRANIVVIGGDRFAFSRFVDDPAPYRVGEVEPFNDDDEPVAQLTALSLRLRELFAEAAYAARTLADEPVSTPTLTEDPAAVAFAAAGSIDLDLAQRQRLLASSSPSGRMREMIALLDASLPELATRAAAHGRAKRNGRGPRLPA